VDLTLTHFRQLAEVTAGLYDVVSRHGLRRITREFVEAVEYRTKLGQRVEGAMGSLWKFEALFLSEHTLDEPVQLLSANERYSDESLLGLRDLGAEPIGTGHFFPGIGTVGSIGP